MSHFSELLSQYIQESPYNIKHLASECHIDRTVIQKYISGQRFPNSYANINKITEKLTLTDQQTNLLKKAYDIEKFGLYEYQYLMRTKNIIEQMHYIKKLSFNVEYQFNINKSFASNKDDLLSLTHFILNDCLNTDCELKASLPANNNLYLLLKNVACIQKKINLKHILHLENDYNNHQNMFNLSQFENCLSTLVADNITVKYIYDNFISNLQSQSAYVYTIHSKNYSLLINSQLNSGILLTGDESTHLKMQFDRAFNDASLYNKRFFSSMSYLNAYSVLENKYTDISLIARNINILYVLDNDLLDRHFIGTKEEEEQLKELLESYKQYITNILPYHQLDMYFSKEGLYDFVESGIINDFPSSFFTPFDKKEVSLLIKRLINLTKHYSNFHLNMIEDQQFKLPLNCFIAYQQNSEVLITFKNNDHYHSCILNEITIKKEFFNLNQLIKIENYTYDNDYTLAYLNSLTKKV